MTDGRQTLARYYRSLVLSMIARYEAEGLIEDVQNTSEYVDLELHYNPVTRQALLEQVIEVMQMETPGADIEDHPALDEWLDALDSQIKYQREVGDAGWLI